MIEAQTKALELFAQTTPGMRAQVGAAAVVATLALLPVAWLGVRRLVPGRNIVFARWGFSHVVMAIGLFVLSALAVAFVGIDTDDVLQLLIANAFAFGVVVIAIGAWAVQLDPDGIRVLGLRAAGTGRALLAGLLTYCAAFPGIAGVTQVWIWLLGLFGQAAAPQEIAARFAALPADERVVPLVLGIVVQPLLEEILFRSFLQPLLVQNFREVMGVGLTSLAFAAVHGEAIALVPIFALSCVLGAIMLRTQSLYAVWLVHALNNALQFAVVYGAPEVAQSLQNP